MKKETKTTNTTKVNKKTTAPKKPLEKGGEPPFDETLDFVRNSVKRFMHRLVEESTAAELCPCCVAKALPLAFGEAVATLHGTIVDMVVDELKEKAGSGK